MTILQNRWMPDPAVTTYYTEKDFTPRMRLLRWLGRQTWIAKGHNRLLTAVMKPELAPDFPFEVDFFGQRYRGNLADYIDWMVFTYGAYAMPELTLLRDLVKLLRRQREGSLSFFDVGANSGHHTLFMSALVDEVIAFEPFPGFLEGIVQKVILNKLGNVSIMPVALGNKDELRNYYLDFRNTNAGMGTFLPDPEKDGPPSAQLLIRKGDDFCAENGLPRIDILKVDVEGFEPLVFEGLRQRLAKDRPIILTELGPEAHELFGSEQAFRSAFYPDARFTAVQGRNGCRYKLTPLHYETSCEILIIPPELVA